MFVVVGERAWNGRREGGSDARKQERARARPLAGVRPDQTRPDLHLPVKSLPATALPVSTVSYEHEISP